MVSIIISLLSLQLKCIRFIKDSFFLQILEVFTWKKYNKVLTVQFNWALLHFITFDFFFHIWLEGLCVASPSTQLSVENCARLCFRRIVLFPVPGCWKLKMQGRCLSLFRRGTKSKWRKFTSVIWSADCSGLLSVGLFLFSTYAYPTMKERQPVNLTKVIDYLHRERNTIAKRYGEVREHCLKISFEEEFFQNCFILTGRAGRPESNQRTTFWLALRDDDRQASPPDWRPWSAGLRTVEPEHWRIKMVSLFKARGQLVVHCPLALSWVLPL